MLYRCWTTLFLEVCFLFPVNLIWEFLLFFWLLVLAWIILVNFPFAQTVVDCIGSDVLDVVDKSVNVCVWIDVVQANWTGVCQWSTVSSISRRSRFLRRIYSMHTPSDGASNGYDRVPYEGNGTSELALLLVYICLELANVILTTLLAITDFLDCGFSL